MSFWCLLLADRILARLRLRSVNWCQAWTALAALPPEHRAVQQPPLFPHTRQQVKVDETGCQLGFLVLTRESVVRAPGLVETVHSHVRGQLPSRGLEFELASTSLGH